MDAPPCVCSRSIVLSGPRLAPPLPKRGSAASDFAVGKNGLVCLRAAASTPQQPRFSPASVRVEANLFSRIVRIFRSYADSIVSSAEDPEKLLDQTVREMQEDLIKMKQTSATVIASQKSMEAKYTQAKKTADEWYSRAQLALEKGDENLAREALKRRRAYQDNADSLKNQLDYQVEAVQTMIRNTRELESKIQEARSKKDTLKARAQSAKASKQVSDMVGSLSTSTSMAAFERMEEKVLKMESEAEATSGLIGDDSLETQFALLEGGTVEDDLAELKNKKIASSAAPPKALPEGRPVKDAIDYELEELRRKTQE